MPLVSCPSPGYHVLSTRYNKTREKDMSQKCMGADKNFIPRKQHQCGFSDFFQIILLVPISLLVTGNVIFPPEIIFFAWTDSWLISHLKLGYQKLSFYFKTISSWFLSENQNWRIGPFNWRISLLKAITIYLLG